MDPLGVQVRDNFS